MSKITMENLQHQFNQFTLKHIQKEKIKIKKLISLTQSQRIFDKKNSLDLSISTLANLDFGSYPSVELSQDSSNIIAGYGANSYNGLIRKNNEDKIKVVPNYKLTKEVKKKNGEIINPNISYFAIYDGHGGNKCSIFLQENLHNYIFSSDYFPLYTMQAIKGAFVKAENNFSSTVIESGNLIDKSGSCAVSALIMDEWCFVINLGDSRALYSFDSGNKLFQITRDHKPNDPIEKERIEKAGGKIYKDEFVTINGKRIKAEEKNLPPGLVLPYRVLPGNLAVSILILIFIIQVARSIGDYKVKMEQFGGKSNTVICLPCVNSFQISDKSDFILLGCKNFLIKFILLFQVMVFLIAWIMIKYCIKFGATKKKGKLMMI